VQGGNIANYSDDEVWQDLKVNYHIVKVWKVALNSKIDFTMNRFMPKQQHREKK
jgi:hypothetical protein